MNDEKAVAPSGKDSETQEAYEAYLRKRRRRSIALALVLVCLVILFYTVTFVKGPAILERPM